MIDHSAMKLGKRPARHDPRTLRLADYTQKLPPAPLAVDWSGKANANYGMMDNDRLGDCTIAAIGHQIQMWTANVNAEVTLGDQVIDLTYQAACGYDPADPATDRGGVELDVLKWWRAQAAGIAGHLLDAFTAVQPSNVAEVKDAIWLFGGLYIGLELPLSAQTQSVWGITSWWSYPDQSTLTGSWGGHAVAVVAYDARGLTCITWGQPKRMTWDFFHAYCSEAYALLSPDWWGVVKSPSGFDQAALEADLAEIT